MPATPLPLPPGMSLDDLPRSVRLNWRDFANCTGSAHLFFGKKAERPEARRRREAKAQALCAECAVVEPCRQFARENREYGYWGGESEEDRFFAGYGVTTAIGVRSRLAKQVS